MANEKKASIRMDGLGYCEEVTRSQLTMLDSRCRKRLRLTLEFSEIGYLAEQLHKMLKLNQDRLDEAKKALRGE